MKKVIIVMMSLFLFSGGAIAKDLKQDARALLMQFLAKGADHAALTQSLRPSKRDIRTVYKAPLSRKLIKYYDERFSSGIPLAPEPFMNDVEIHLSSTGKLAASSRQPEEFPPEFRQIAKYVKKDVPIVQFRFFRKGNRLSLNINGLVYVNNHWVLMPKPWRALK